MSIGNLRERTPKTFSREGVSPSALAHLLYLYILQQAQPYETVYITIRQMSRATRIPPWRITELIKILQKTKPWLTWRLAGPKGWAIFYRPDAGYRSKRQSPSTPTPKRKVLRPSSDSQSTQNQEKPQTPHPPNQGHTSPHKAWIKGKLMTVTEWNRRTWMKRFRKKAERDPALKWTKSLGINVVHIVGHFVWHIKKPLEIVARKISAWLYWWTSGYVPLPETPRALAQFLFVTLNAFVHGKEYRLSGI